jgi:hypothetical protein
VLVSQEGWEEVPEGSGPALFEVEYLRDGGQDQSGVTEGSQGNKEDTIGKVSQDLGRHLYGQAGFANATGAGEGDKTDLGAAQQGTDGSHLLVTPNERSELRGQGVGRSVFGSGERGSRAKRSRKRMSVSVDSAAGSRHMSIGIRVEIALDNHLRSDSVEPLEGHLLGLPQVGFAKLALLLVIEVPVPVLTSALSPHGKDAQLVAEGKGLMLLSCQPAVPGLWANHDGFWGSFEQV